VQGLALHPLFTVPVAFGVLPLLPLLAARPLKRLDRNGVLTALATAALAFAITAGLVPAYSEAAPQRLNIDFVDDHIAHKAEWAIETGARLPAVFRRYSNPAFSKDSQPISPLLRQPAYVMPAGATRFAEPTVTATAASTSTSRTVTLTLHGSPDANRIVLVVPKEEGLLRAEIEGHVLLPAPRSLNPVGTIIACVTDDCRDKTVTLVFWSPGPKHILLGEQHFGLPPDGAWFQSLRPPEAIASQSGDTTIVFTKLAVR